MRIIVALLSVLLGPLSLTTAQTQLPTKDELAAQIPGLSSVPGFDSFNASSVNTEEIQKQLESKCKKNGGPTAFETAKNTPQFLQECMSSLVNMTVLQQEMEDAKPKGELDTVFNKYCNKVPELEKCVQNATDTFAPCLEDDEKDSIEIIRGITKSLLEFICHNEGDRIAMFIAAGGIECFKEKQPGIETCANQTFGKYLPAAQNASSHLTSIPLLVIKLEDCMNMERFKDCVVPVLETCSDPTPGNVVDSLFTYVKKVTPCEIMLKERAEETRASDPKSAATTSIVNLLLITSAMLMSLKFV